MRVDRNDALGWIIASVAIGITLLWLVAIAWLILAFA
jgi:hypothetical protein